jgi:hypothetical protein
MKDGMGWDGVQGVSVVDRTELKEGTTQTKQDRLEQTRLSRTQTFLIPRRSVTTTRLGVALLQWWREPRERSIKPWLSVKHVCIAVWVRMRITSNVGQ